MHEPALSDLQLHIVSVGASLQRVVSLLLENDELITDDMLMEAARLDTASIEPLPTEAEQALLRINDIPAEGRKMLASIARMLLNESTRHTS